MLVLVMIETRLSKRPLNLVQRPTVISAVTSMVASEPSTRAVFQGLDLSSDEAMRRTLDGYLFSLRNGILYTHKAERNEQFSSCCCSFWPSRCGRTKLEAENKFAPPRGKKTSRLRETRCRVARRCALAFAKLA